MINMILLPHFKTVLYSSNAVKCFKSTQKVYGQKVVETAGTWITFQIQT